MLMLLATIALGLLMGLGTLLVGVYILWFGNRKMWRLNFNPIFIFKANLAGVAALLLGGGMMVAVVVGGFKEYQKQARQRPAPPVVAKNQPQPPQPEVGVKPPAPPPAPPIPQHPQVNRNVPPPNLLAEDKPLPPPEPAALDAARERYLRELEPLTVEVLTRDEHKLLRDFSVRGVSFTHGLYTHPPDANRAARVTFQLDKQFERLRGAVGQSDGFPPRSFTGLTFRVVGDGRELWSSRVISEHGQWQAFDVNVRDVERLELVTDCPGFHTHAWGAWLDPVLVK
jgi:hypothetical protein